MTKRNTIYRFKCAVILERLSTVGKKFRLVDDGFRLLEWHNEKETFTQALARIYPQLEFTEVKIIVIGTYTVNKTKHVLCVYITNCFCVPTSDEEGDELITNPSVDAQAISFRHWIGHHHYCVDNMIKIFIEVPLMKASPVQDYIKMCIKQLGRFVIPSPNWHQPMVTKVYI